MRIEVDGKRKKEHDVFALRVRGGRHVYTGTSYRSLVSDLRTGCMYEVKSNKTYMRDVARRIQNGADVDVDTSTERRFILCLLDLGFVKQVSGGYSL